MPKEKLHINLTSADSLFTTQEERDNEKLENIKILSIDEIEDFPNHPFKVREDEELMNLAESIRHHGVLMPALVRPGASGGYQMVSGHRRKLAAKIAGVYEIPCVVRELSDDAAVIVMVDANMQREHILPSEKAFAYQMKLDAMKRQGERTDLTSTPVVGKRHDRESAEILGKENSESREQVRRFIRLTNLISPILDMVDSGKISFRPAVELSYLSTEHQELLLDTMELEECTPSLTQSVKMKQFAQEERLNSDVIYSILSEDKPNQKEIVKISKDKINQYFPKSASKKVIEDTIVKALEYYKDRDRQKDNTKVR